MLRFQVLTALRQPVFGSDCKGRTLLEKVT
jgi:hypothetical protein